ncbi:hypothetical protein BKA65DRAFT_507466 [Rhexocercosporidium sp. MPI-PUGE-AT-0058]|nr:hypothetical protein BKA65DRAFT_507466 [Rhexocercosporidium sp. MPI-PUGE-AT-0058]
MRPSLRILSLFFVPPSLVCSISQVSQVCTLPPGFAAPNRTDFRLCHDKISNLTTEARNNSGCFDDPADGVLTLDGCYAMCGIDNSYWEWKDLFNRLSLLVLPTVFLIADLGFPPLGWHIFLIVPIQAIGNPIGRFQSLLIRFTTHRSYRRLAEAQSQLISPNHPPQFFAFYKSLATVFSAYEEFGWQNVAATENWLVTFSDQEQRIVTCASYRLSSLRVRSKVLPIVAIATLVGTLVVAIFRTIQQIDRSNTRITNETAHTIAVVCILYITIPQVWFGARIGIFTTDAEAIHILENMRDELERLKVPNNRNRPLLPPLQFAVCQGHKVWSLVPWAGFFARCPLEHSEPQPEITIDKPWRGIKGNFMGISSSWRGCNRMAVDAHAPSHGQLLSISYLFAIFGASLPAYFLSATNNATRMKVGIGCRSLSWIGVLAVWIFSYTLDSIFRGYVCWPSASSAPEAPIDKLRKIWRLSLFKDLLMTGGVITLVMLVQVGRYNSCWCRSSFHDFVMIFGYKPPEWVRAKSLWRIIPSIGLGINLALIMWVEFALWDGDNWLGWLLSFFVWNRNGWLRYVPSFAIRSGTPLCKNEKEMEAEWNQLRAFPPPPARGRAAALAANRAPAPAGSNNAVVEGNAEEQGVEMSVLGAPVPAEHEQTRLLGGWPVAD